MDSKMKKIAVTFRSEGFFDDCEMEKIDARATARKYCELVREAIVEEYDCDDITVEMGDCSSSAQIITDRGDGCPGDDFGIQHIVHRVWDEGWFWVDEQ